MLPPPPLRSPSDDSTRSAKEPLLDSAGLHPLVHANSYEKAVKSWQGVWSSIGQQVLKSSGVVQKLRSSHKKRGGARFMLPHVGADSKRILPFGDTVTCVSIDDEADPRNGGIFAAGGVNRKVEIYDLNSGRLLKTIRTEEPISSCQLVRLPPRKHAIVIGTFNGLVEAFDIDSGAKECRQRFSQGEEVHSVSASRRTPRPGGASPMRAAAQQQPRRFGPPMRSSSAPHVFSALARSASVEWSTELIAVGGKSHFVMLFAAEWSKGWCGSQMCARCALAPPCAQSPSTR